MTITPDSRRQAEEKVLAMGEPDPESFSPDNIRGLLHELHVHQIELEMQNEELRRAQEALEISRSRYFDLYDLAPVGYVTLCEQGLILEANLRAATLLGAPRSALVKLPLSRSIFAEDQDIYYRCRKQLMATGMPQASELRMTRQDGTYFWARVEASLAQDAESGAPVSRVILSDIGERKMAEEAVLEAGHRKDEFLAVLAHELRNPLAPIRNAVEVLNRLRSEEPSLLWAREMIDRQVRHLVRLVDDLLDVSRIARQIVTLRKERIELSALVARAVEATQPFIEQCRHTLIVEVPPDPIYLEGDAVRLVQVLQNLLDNAAKYTEPGGTLWLSAECTPGTEPGEIVLRVRDTGIGIDPEFQPRVFDLFSRSSHAVDRLSQSGLGIGLSLVKQLAELHGGRVEAHSAGLGQGTEFTVRLPLLPLPPI